MDQIHVTFRRLNTWAKRKFDTLFLLLLYTLAGTHSLILYYMYVIILTHLCIGYIALGSMGKFLVDFSVIVSQIGQYIYICIAANGGPLVHNYCIVAGFTCAYLIFISENLSSIYPKIPK